MKDNNIIENIKAENLEALSPGSHHVLNERSFKFYLKEHLKTLVHIPFLKNKFLAWGHNDQYRLLDQILGHLFPADENKVDPKRKKFEGFDELCEPVRQYVESEVHEYFLQMVYLYLFNATRYCGYYCPQAFIEVVNKVKTLIEKGMITWSDYLSLLLKKDAEQGLTMLQNVAIYSNSNALIQVVLDLIFLRDNDDVDFGWGEYAEQLLAKTPTGFTLLLAIARHCDGEGAAILFLLHKLKELRDTDQYHQFGSEAYGSFILERTPDSRTLLYLIMFYSGVKAKVAVLNEYEYLSVNKLAGFNEEKYEDLFIPQNFSSWTILQMVVRFSGEHTPRVFEIYKRLRATRPLEGIIIYARLFLQLSKYKQNLLEMAECQFEVNSKERWRAYEQAVLSSNDDREFLLRVASGRAPIQGLVVALDGLRSVAEDQECLDFSMINYSKKVDRFFDKAAIDFFTLKFKYNMQCDVNDESLKFFAKLFSRPSLPVYYDRYRHIVFRNNMNALIDRDEEISDQLGMRNDHNRFCARMACYLFYLYTGYDLAGDGDVIKKESKLKLLSLLDQLSAAGLHQSLIILAKKDDIYNKVLDSSSIVAFNIATFAVEKNPKKFSKAWQVFLANEILPTIACYTQGSIEPLLAVCTDPSHTFQERTVLEHAVAHDNLGIVYKLIQSPRLNQKLDGQMVFNYFLGLMKTNDLMPFHIEAALNLNINIDEAGLNFATEALFYLVSYGENELLPIFKQIIAALRIDALMIESDSKGMLLEEVLSNSAWSYLEAVISASKLQVLLVDGDDEEEGSSELRGAFLEISKELLCNGQVSSAVHLLKKLPQLSFDEVHEILSLSAHDCLWNYMLTRNELASLSKSNLLPLLQGRSIARHLYKPADSKVPRNLLGLLLNRVLLKLIEERACDDVEKLMAQQGMKLHLYNGWDAVLRKLISMTTVNAPFNLSLYQSIADYYAALPLPSDEEGDAPVKSGLLSSLIDNLTQALPGDLSEDEKLFSLVDKLVPFAAPRANSQMLAYMCERDCIDIQGRFLLLMHIYKMFEYDFEYRTSEGARHSFPTRFKRYANRFHANCPAGAAATVSEKEGSNEVFIRKHDGRISADLPAFFSARKAATPYNNNLRVSAVFQVTLFLRLQSVIASYSRGDRLEPLLDWMLGDLLQLQHTLQAIVSRFDKYCQGQRTSHFGGLRGLFARKGWTSSDMLPLLNGVCGEINDWLTDSPGHLYIAKIPVSYKEQEQLKDVLTPTANST